MKLQNMSLEVTLKEVEHSRAGLINYARYIFEREQNSAIYAFSQFSNEDLISLILAKRKGVFDYGKHLQRDGVDGWKHPSTKQAILLLSKTMEEKGLEPVSMRVSLESLEDVEISVNERFIDVTVWNKLSKNKKEEERKRVLTSFYDDNGIYELQRLHYEILNTQSKKTDSPEGMVARILDESDWIPIRVREVKRTEYENSWSTFKNRTNHSNVGAILKMKQLEQRIEVLEQSVATKEELLELSESVDRKLAQLTFSTVGLRPLSNEEEESKTEEPKEEKKIYKEADLLLMNIAQVKKIASEDFGLEVDSLIIKRLVIKRVLEAQEKS